MSSLRTHTRADEPGASARALRERIDFLERHNAELERFVTITAHDLSEPLRVVAGYASLLSEGTTGALREEQAELVDRIDTAARRMQTLLDDLLRYSQAEYEIEPADVDLGSLLADALADLQAALSDRSARVVVRAPLPVVWGDRTQLRQVLQNLLANAIKFGPEVGGIIEITAAPHDDGWRIAVRDRGPGIASEDQLRIFEPFRRLRGTGRLPGSGLGLAICRRIVTRHGGDLEVESAPGEGATFSFTLPGRDSTARAG